jgi:ADP-heptose:LPS heptosyltransferase
MSRSVLVARLDSAGDVLLAGPAIRAVAASSDRVVLLCGRRGFDAARLLPGVDDVLCWTAPWIDADPAPVSPREIQRFMKEIARRHIGEAVIFTSFHQSALPLALLLRLVGVARVSAVSDDYPGSLLDVRRHVATGVPEAQRALSLAEAAGFPLPDNDDGRLRVRDELPDIGHLIGTEKAHVVVHPGTSVPARAWPAEHFAELVAMLADAGFTPVVTGSSAEVELTSAVAGSEGTDLGGALSFAELAAVLKDARAIVVGNTGPAHLAAAVGTPVVSLFAPTVPASQWRPYRVPHVLLGDQSAPCKDSRARSCPIEGHPCLSTVTPAQALLAVRSLVELASRHVPDDTRDVVLA